MSRVKSNPHTGQHEAGHQGGSKGALYPKGALLVDGDQTLSPACMGRMSMRFSQRAHRSNYRKTERSQSSLAIVPLLQGTPTSQLWDAIVEMAFHGSLLFLQPSINIHHLRRDRLVFSLQPKSTSRRLFYSILKQVMMCQAWVLNHLTP